METVFNNLKVRERGRGGRGVSSADSPKKRTGSGILPELTTGRFRYYTQVLFLSAASWWWSLNPSPYPV